MNTEQIKNALALKGFKDADFKKNVIAFQKSVGLAADGDPGPMTQAELFPAVPVVRNYKPRWPSQSECVRFYGAPGNPRCTAGMVTPKRTLRYDNQVVNTFRCHELVEHSFQSVFDQTIDHYGEAEWRRLGLDRFSGCFNVRKMRGGTSWSMHSWGIAYDLDAARNSLHQTSKTAQFAKPEYKPYWDIVESEGLVSLGRKKDFDWMHVQAATLR